MTSRTRVILLAALLALATSVMYLWRLGDTPIYLTRDETFVGLTGHSLASKGRDLQGRFMPLYLYSRVDGNWWAPMLPYATAGALKLLPFSEGSVRAPMAVAAVINVVLVFFVGRLLFDRQHLALVPAVLLAITPAQLIENRYANDPGLAATFALGWMLAGLTYLRTGNPRALFAAGVVLGVGFYSYVGAIPLMPIYMVMTCVVLLRRRDSPTRYLTFAAGFVIPIAIGLPWLVQNPAAFRTIVLHYQNDEFRNVDTFTAFKAFATLRRVAEIGILYFQFWDPRFLFIHGAPVLMHSTGHVGVFLVSVAGLLVVGIVRTARRAVVDAGALLLLGGFLLAPLPASLVDFNDHLARHAIWRAVEVMPFGALLAGLGLEYSLTGASTRKRQLALCIALAIPSCLVAVSSDSLPNGQALLRGLVVPPAIVGLSVLLATIVREDRSRLRFALLKRLPSERLVVASVVLALGTVSALQYRAFYVDYMTDYRNRFITETDGNMRGVLEAVIERSPVIEPSQQRPTPTVYLGFRLGPGDWGYNYWLFYLHKHHREDLLLRTINDIDASQFNHDRICQMATGSLLATRVGWDKATDALIARMTTRGELTREVVVGDPMYWLMRTTESCTPG